MNGKKLQLKIMSILIFGGAGFVGRHYVEHFLKKKESVEVVDNIAPLSGGIHPKKWKLSSKEIRPYVNKIGNLIIIERELNRAMGNQTLDKKINGFIYNGDERSYYEDECHYNKNLFDKIKKDLESKKFQGDGALYWDRSRIEKRIIDIGKEFNIALSKYLDD